MALELMQWDSTEHMKTGKDFAGFIEAVFEYDDPMIAEALETVARARARYELPVEPYTHDGLDAAARQLVAAFRAVGLRLSAVPYVEWREDEDEAAEPSRARAQAA